MTGDQAILLAALVSPLAGAGAALVMPARVGPSGPRRALQIAALVCAACWGLLLARPGVVRLGFFHSETLAAACGCGAALLAASVDRPRAAKWATAMLGLALAAIGAGFSSGSGGGHAAGIGAGAAVAAIFTVAAAWDRGRVASSIAAAAAIAGIGATAAGLVMAHGETGSWLLPGAATMLVNESVVLVLLGAAGALCVAGGLRPGMGTTLLLAAGLTLGLRAGPLATVPGGGFFSTDAGVIGGGGPAEGLAGAVLVFAVLAALTALLRRAPLAFALLAVGLAAGPPEMLAASRLLAAAALLALAIDRRPALILFLPGTVAVATGAIESGTGSAYLCVLVTAAVAAVIAVTVAVDRLQPVRRRIDLALVPAVAIASWLVLAPNTWTWTGSPMLRPYDVGAARACAAGLIVAIVVVAWRSRRNQPLREAGTEPDIGDLHDAVDVDARPEGTQGDGGPEPEGGELVRSDRSAP